MTIAQLWKREGDVRSGWFDVVDPQADDIDWLQRTFAFHPMAMEDVTRRHQRAKLDEYPGYYFGVLYAARIDNQRRRTTTAELQFFWSPTYLVTIHSDALPEIDDLASRMQTGAVTPLVDAANRPIQIPDIVYRLLDNIVDGYFPAVDAIADWTDDIEEHMFSGSSRPETLQTIFALRKNLIQLRKIVAPSRDALNSLLRRDRALYGEEFYPYFQDIYDHTVRVIDSLDTYRDLLGSALDTYLSLISNDVSQTVKKMTAVTAILMVTALIAGIYGMNFDVMPELHWAFGYPYALGLMLGCAIALWLLFRRIRWL